MQDILNKLSLRQIRYFVAVAEAKSFRKASAILHMSQPPLTQHIKALEEALGVELFDRSDRQISLTMAGEELLVSSRNVLSSLTRDLEHIKSIGRGLEGTIRIGVTNDFIYSQILSDIEEYCTSRPRILIEINVAMSPTLADLLHNNSLDLILSVQNPLKWKGDFVERKLPDSRLVALVSDNHELCSKTKLSVGDLRDQDVITYPDSCDLPIAMECSRLFSEADVIPRARYFTSHVAIATQLVANGKGIALASEHSVPRSITGVQVIPLKEQASISRVLMYAKKHRHPALASLVQHLLKKQTDTDSETTDH